MTDTLTDRERELVEAARAFKNEDCAANAVRLGNALRAYDPPKVKKYTMPTWEEFCEGKMTTTIDGWPSFTYVDLVTRRISEDDYNAIREALATEEE